MNLRTVIVDLDSIQAEPYKGSADAVEALANTIIQLRGLISLPVIKMLAIDEYELLSGELEFYAYAQAQKIDDSLPDRIMAFLANDKTIEPIQKQHEVLAIVMGSATHPLTVNDRSDLKISNLSNQINELSKSQNESVEEIRSNIISSIQATIPKPFPLIVALANISKQRIQDIITRSFSGGKNNNKKVTQKGQEITNRLLTSHQQGQEFKNFQDVLKVLATTGKQKQTRLVTEKKMLEVIDQFIRLLANDRDVQNLIQPQEVLTLARDSSGVDASEVSSIAQDTSGLSAQIKHLSESQDKTFASLQAAIIQEIQDKIPQPLPLLAALNRIQEDKVKHHVINKLSFLGAKKVEKIIEKLEDARNNGQQFQYFEDVLRVLVTTQNSDNGEKIVRLVSEKKMLEIVDRWHL